MAGVRTGDSFVDTLWESDLDTVIVLDASCVGPITRHLFGPVGVKEPGPGRVGRSVSRVIDGRETDVQLDADSVTVLICRSTPNTQTARVMASPRPFPDHGPSSWRT